MESLTSLCITTFNESKTIIPLLDSILSQTKLPNEIIIVDAGSTDETIQKIKLYKKISKACGFAIKLIISKGASIAKGRNIAVKNAKYEIIVMTDAGCILDQHWLERITHSFTVRASKSPDITAGFYKMTGNSNFQKAIKPFLGIMPENFDKNNFLPSARSIAFTKSIWKKAGGFNEKLDRAGEDSDFNKRLIKVNAKYERIKNAIVYWEVPNNLLIASKKFFYYSKGDVQSNNMSHNIKVLTIFIRYFIFFFLPILFPFYVIFPIWKFRKHNFNWSIRFWTVIIQLGSDLSVMLGFISGVWAILNQ